MTIVNPELGSQLTQPTRSLRAIWDAVELNLREKMPRINRPIPFMGYGRDKLNHIKSPPSVVAVPDRGTSPGPEPRRGNGVDQTWKLWVRAVVLQVYCWDEDETATEVLANHVVASFHDQLAGYYEMAGEQWGDSKDTKFGDELVLGVRVKTTWSREWIPAVIPATMEIDGTITQPTH